MSLLIALLVALVLGGGGTFYFWNIRRRRDEAAAGIRALSAMRWREFSHFVLDAMRHRGYDVLTPSDEVERGQQTEFLLAKDGKRTLLSCKHGSAYRIAAPAVAELAGSMRFQGVTSGILITPGTIEADARAAARESNIELIDGARLWPEIAPLLPQSLREDVLHSTDANAKRQIGVVWFSAVAVGVIAALLIGGTAEPVATTPSVAAAPAPHSPAKTATAVIPALTVTTPEEEEAQRVEVVHALSSLQGVDRALWSTRSTLLVHLAEGAPDLLTEICTVLERYDNLRASRIQLQPPPGSEQRVRFRQCRTY
jgi:restriction system protein